MANPIRSRYVYYDIARKHDPKKLLRHLQQFDPTLQRLNYLRNDNSWILHSAAIGTDVKSADFTHNELRFPWSRWARERRILTEIRDAGERVNRAIELGLPEPERLWQRQGSWIIYKQRWDRGVELSCHEYDYRYFEYKLPFRIGSKYRDRRIGLWNYKWFEILLPFGTRSMMKRTGIRNYTFWEVFLPFGDKMWQNRTKIRDFTVLEIVLPTGEQMRLKRIGVYDNPQLIIS